MITLEEDRCWKGIKLVTSTFENEDNLIRLEEEFFVFSNSISKLLINNYDVKEFNFNIYFSIKNNDLTSYPKYDDSFFIFGISLLRTNIKKGNFNFKEHVNQGLESFIKLIDGDEFQKEHVNLLSKSKKNLIKPILFYKNIIEAMISGMMHNYIFNDVDHIYFKEEVLKYIKSGSIQDNKIEDLISCISAYSTIETVSEIMDAFVLNNPDADPDWYINQRMFLDYILLDEYCNKNNINKIIFDKLDISNNYVLMIVYNTITSNTITQTDYGLNLYEAQLKIKDFILRNNVKINVRIKSTSTDRFFANNSLRDIDQYLLKDADYIVNSYKLDYKMFKFISQNYENVLLDSKIKKDIYHIVFKINYIFNF